jgi:hypothetical protein
VWASGEKLPQLESPEVKNRFISACKANSIAAVQLLEEGCIFSDRIIARCATGTVGEKQELS